MSVPGKDPVPGYDGAEFSRDDPILPELVEQLWSKRDAAKAQKNAALSQAIKIINEKRNKWMDDLQKSGISTRPATHAVHMLSFYKKKYGLMPEDFPNAYAADQCSISLPLFHGMEPEEQGRVIEVIKSYNF